MIALVSGSIGLFVAAAILILMRRDKLHARHGLGWLLVAGVFACLGFAPGIVDTVAQWLGIEYPPILALTLGMALIVLKLLLVDIERSRIEMRNQRLTQRIAMLEATVRQQQKLLDTGGGTSETPPTSRR